MKRSSNQRKSKKDDKPMKLRKRNQVQYFESSQSDSDSPSPVVVGKKQDKKGKEPTEFKRGEYNHKIKEIPNLCKQLQGNQKEQFDCCVRCANRELIRAVIINDYKMFERVLKSGKISDPFQKWAPDNNFTLLHEIFKLNDKKYIECLLKFIYNKPKFAPEVKFGLKHVDTGYNSYSAYGRHVRKVQVSRKGKQGNNAFVDDVFREGWWSVGLIAELVSLKSDIKCWQILVKSQILPKNVVDRIYDEIRSAVESGNYKLAGYLISLIHQHQQSDYNILHLNVLTKTQPKELGDIKKVSVTKKNGDDILTPLHCAAINPNPRILECLLNIAPEYSILDSRMRRPIHYAAACETSGPVEFLISKGVDVREGDNLKTQPVMIAAQYGRLHNLPLLLKEGQENAKNRTGMAAIHYAAKGGHLECVKFFLKQGTNPNLPGESRQSVLHFAAANNHHQLVEFLLTQKITQQRDKFGRSPLIMAARNGSLTSLAILLKHGADFNKPDSSKNTALHYAAAYGFIECVELLIRAGADQNLTNSWNLTPLSVALGKNHKKIADYLLSLPSTDINCKDDKGRTLIANEVLRKKINIENLNSLLQKKADINLCDLQGQTPLHHAACRSDSSDIIKLLLSKNVDVNITDKNGLNAFMSAINSGNYGNAKLILYHPSFDLKQRDKKGQTILQQLIESNAFFDQANGQPIIEQVMSTLSFAEKQNSNVDNMNAHDQLVISFVQNIKTFYHSQVKTILFEELIKQHKNGDVQDKDMEVEDQKKDDEDEEENDEGSEDGEDGDDEGDEDEEEGDDEEEENEDEMEDQEEEIPVSKKKVKGKRNMEEEEDDEDNEDDEDDEENSDQSQNEQQINEELLSHDDDEDLPQDDAQLDKLKDYQLVLMLGKKYRVSKPFQQKEYQKFSFIKYIQEWEFDVDFHDGKNKNKKIYLKPSPKLVQQVSDQVIVLCQEIEKFVIQTLNYKLPKNQTPYQDKNGARLIHYVYSYYPKLSLIQVFNQEIVKDNNQQTQLHYFARFAQPHPLYQIEEIVDQIPQYFDQDSNGETVFSQAAKRYFFYKNVDHINLLNQVPLFEQIKQKKVDDQLLNLVDPNFTDQHGRNGLHYSMMYNDENTLKHLIQKGANIHKKDKFGRTPLFYAFVNDNDITNLTKYDPFEIVVYLAKDCDVVDIYGRNCLHYAAQRGSCMSARQLLSKNIKLDTLDQWGNTPLSLAFLGNHLDAAIMLIDNKYTISHELNVVDYQEVKDMTFTKEELKQNAKISKKAHNKISRTNNSSDDDEDDEDSENDYQSETDSIKTLDSQLIDQIRREQRYKNVDSDDENEEKKKEIIQKYEPRLKIGKYSYYRMALQNEWPEVEYLLLANGFSLNQAIQDCLIESKFGRAANLMGKANPIDLQNTEPNLWQIFAKYGKDSIQQKFFSIITNLLGCVSSQKADESLRTPLHYACENGFIKLVQHLMKIQININGKDTSQNTPFALYVQKVKSIDIELLNEWIKFEADISQPIQIKGNSVPPLIYITRYKNFFNFDKKADQTILDTFLSNGSRVNDSDSNGKTLLIAAIEQNNFPLVKAIWKNVDKKQVDSFGKTPLFYVVNPTEYGTYDNIEMLKFLYPHFDANKKDNQLKTILDYVQQFDNCEIKSFIEKQEIKSNKNLPRRAPTSAIANVDWPKENVDYITDASNFLNKCKQLQPVKDVDFLAKRKLPNTELYQDYSCVMTKVDVNASMYELNVFYKMQILREFNRDFYVLVTRWGQAYSSGQCQCTPYQDVEECIKEFKKIFKSKSGNDWGQQFQPQPKKYHLVVQKTHRNIEKYLKPFNSPVESKLSPSLVQVFKDFSNVKEYLDKLPALKIDEDTLENIAKDDLEQAGQVLQQLEQAIKQFGKAKEDRELDIEQLERLGTEMAQLSNKYYQLIPTCEGLNKINIQAIVDEETLQEHQRRVNTLMDFEVSTKIFLGALSQQFTINPYDYCLNAINIRIASLTPDSIEYKMIEVYAKQKIKALFCVERKGEAQRFKKIQNRYLLWHGTKATNYIGIFALGLRIAPSWAGETGSRFGKGIYFADSLKKSIDYSDDKKYLLLCEVALGKYTECDSNKNKFDQNVKYQSVKYLGQHEPNPSKCITIGNGCKVPVGEMVKERQKADDEWNEYIVYSEDQVRIRYLVQLADELEIEE